MGWKVCEALCVRQVVKIDITWKWRRSRARAGQGNAHHPVIKPTGTSLALSAKIYLKVLAVLA